MELYLRKIVSRCFFTELITIEYLDPKSTKYAQMIDWIRRDLNVTSLKYLAIEDMIAAIGLPADQLCLHCLLGK